MGFDDLKNRNSEVELDRLRKHVRFDFGKHKSTKLKRVRTYRRKTLLDDDASEAHSMRLLKQFMDRWKSLSSDEANQRLRLWTVLGSVCDVDEDVIAEHVAMLRNKLMYTAHGVKGIEVIGVIEIEIVSWKLMESLKSQGNLSNDQSRKYTVLDSISNRPVVNLNNLNVKLPDSGALIHFHGIVDLGMNEDIKEKKLKADCKRYWSKPYQVELKPIFKNKKVGSSLQDIARYLVKGGNETLHYKIGFGRDSIQRLEAAMLKSGKKDLGEDFEGFENEFSLTLHETKVLDASIDRMMGEKSTHRNGYLFKHGQQIKWIRP